MKAMLLLIVFLFLFCSTSFSEQIQSSIYCTDGRDCCRKYVRCLDALLGQNDETTPVDDYACPVPKCRIGYEYIPYPDTGLTGRCVKYDQSLSTQGIRSYNQKFHEEYSGINDCRSDLFAGTSSIHCFEGYWQTYRGCLNGMQLRD